MNDESPAELAFADAVKSGTIDAKSFSDPAVKPAFTQAYTTALLGERERCCQIAAAGRAAGRLRLAVMLIEAGTPTAEACIKIRAGESAAGRL